MSELVEKVAEIVNETNPDSCSLEAAQAAIAAVFDTVEAHLSAVQYDPAPYTALKQRLAHLRSEALG